MIKKIMAMLVVICSVAMVKSAQTPPNRTLQLPPNQTALYNAAREAGRERRRVAAARGPQAPGVRLGFGEEPEDEVGNPFDEVGNPFEDIILKEKEDR